MRILIVNDDGIHSEGLHVLEQIALELSDDVWVVAPESDQSGVAHSLTLNDPLRLRKIDERHFAVRGTPTDCVIMAVSVVLDKAPDLILSGINKGCNVADDVTYSGTIAGAMEGTLLGIRSIAVSQHYNFTELKGVDYAPALKHGAALIKELLDYDLPAETLLNVNFPAVAPQEVKGVQVVRQGKRSTDSMFMDGRKDGRGNPYYWLAFNNGEVPRVKGTDIDAIEDGYIAVTPLHLNLTADELMGSLAQHLQGAQG
ncbi:5'/3'-nucleotidase SurE [Polycladidibacter hongkongensis]|uniref:5'/3'-nucleotidase SurE n=1 Tax=Polycladidibacter hongkongensis TaxID=1647556 RepID=UPI00082B0C9A|nr:5'/3'-nucleotidase SurE [Pseudovibrio hongkongensis]